MANLLNEGNLEYAKRISTELEQWFITAGVSPAAQSFAMALVAGRIYGCRASGREHLEDGLHRHYNLMRHTAILELQKKDGVQMRDLRRRK